MVKDTDCAAIVRGKNEWPFVSKVGQAFQADIRLESPTYIGRDWAPCGPIIGRHLVIRKQKALFPDAHEMRGGAVDGVGRFAQGFGEGGMGVDDQG